MFVNTWSRFINWQQIADSISKDLETSFLCAESIILAVKNGRSLFLSWNKLILTITCQDHPGLRTPRQASNFRVVRILQGKGG